MPLWVTIRSESEPAAQSSPGICLRRLLMLSAAFCGLLAGAAYGQAELPPPPQIEAQLMDALDRKGDLTLQGSTLRGALFTISEQWRINIVAGDVEGAVNGVFKDAPLREILDSILLSNGYGYRAVGQSLVVSRLSELGQVNPFFVSETISIRAADVNEVVDGARLLSTPSGQVRAIPSARSIVVLDFPDRVEKIRRFIAAVDEATIRTFSGAAPGATQRSLEVAYLKTHFVKAEDMLTLLDAVLSSDGKATVMKREDRLLVVDYAENLRMVRQVIEHADRPRPQVAIQALIYDISLQDLEELGLNWHSVSNGNLSGATVGAGGGLTGTGALASGTGTLINSVTKAPFADGAAGGAFTLYNLSNNFSMAAVAMALQNAADSRLLASPNVSVIENEKASIQSIQEIPYQQLTQTAAGGNIGTTAFKEAGITLEVIPKIGSDGVIEMEVRPEFSRLTGFTPGDNQPIIDKRVATTNVRIANGSTFVIGGLRQRTDVGDFKGIPFLKDVRVIGPLFRSRETDVRESELMVFIRPTIISACQPLCSREQRAVDTIDCRLDRIPVPEGCPPDYCDNGVGCSECGESNEIGQPTPTGVLRLPPTEAPTSAQSNKPTRSKMRYGSKLRPGYNERYQSSESESSQQPAAEQAALPARRPFWR